VLGRSRNRFAEPEVSQEAGTLPGHAGLARESDDRHVHQQGIAGGVRKGVQHDIDRPIKSPVFRPAPPAQLQEKVPDTCQTLDRMTLPCLPCRFPAMSLSPTPTANAGSPTSTICSPSGR